ncbi:hypothetical protein [Methylobacterium symbioticum]|uniref:Uncharacterized protein n=1 Tax=Methylobacterium symbioticum TaxID=2584084 RepID=A0A509EJ92_9HYPH|nr:hypothetical protein [Methylobacterium symbioticum]VUD74228.1 hypothetical protein MET9862_04856 [Methylobacterium symbioticum]
MLHRLFAGTVLALPLLLAAPAFAKDPPKETPAEKAAPTEKAPSPGQTAARERQKQCGAEWRALTDAQKTAQGPKWPQYWSKCNKRLKGGGKA